MVSTYVKCEHPATARYWDLDEVRCRACATSLTFPARPPGPDDKADRRQDARLAQGESKRVYIPLESLESLDDTDDGRHYVATSCLRCKVQVLVQPDAGGAVSCACGAALVNFDRLGKQHFPDFTAPRLLPCKCCLETLPQFCFYQGSKTPSREGRFSTCRKCCSAQARARRITNPEPKLTRDLEYSQRIQAERVAGERPPVRNSLTEDQREKQRLSNQRYKARLKGRAIPLLRPGRKAVYFASTCRVIACPLRLGQAVSTA